MLDVKLCGFILLALLTGSTWGQCQCQNSTTVEQPSSGYAVSLWGPTIGGVGSGVACNASCSTTVTFVGNNATSYYINLFITLATLTSTNFVEISGGNQIINLTTSQRGATYNFTSNTITLQYKFVSGGTYFFATATASQVAIVPATTPSTITTTPYDGPYETNPSTALLDLIIAVDQSDTAAQLNQVRDIANIIASNFTYSNTTTRLSLLTFNGFTSSVYTNLIWTLNANTLASQLLNVNSFSEYPDAPSSSNVSGTLTNFVELVKKNPFFAFRPNVQRVLLYFTSHDANDPTSVGQSLSLLNIHVIVATPNTTNALSNLVNILDVDPSSSYQYIWAPLLPGSASDSAPTLIHATLDGTKLCNLKPTYEYQTLQTYSIPTISTNPSSLYCNGISTTTVYQRSGTLLNYTLTFSNFSTTVGNDVVTVSADGKPIAELSGIYEESAVFKIPVQSSLSISFKSGYGYVNTGFTVDVEQTRNVD